MGVAPLERTALKALTLRFPFRCICQLPQFPLPIGGRGGEGVRPRPSGSPRPVPPLHPMERGPGGEVPVPPARAVLLRYASAALFLLHLCFPAFAAESSDSNNPTVILVIGAPGEAEFGTNFLRQATLWQKVCSEANCRHITIGLDSAKTNDYEQIKDCLAAQSKEGLAALWLVLI